MAASRGYGAERTCARPAAASATAAAITERLEPAGWTVATARELQRVTAGPGRRETTTHEVVARATRHS